MGDVFADLTGLSSGPKPMRAQPASSKPARSSQSALFSNAGSSGAPPLHGAVPPSGNDLLGLEELDQPAQRAAQSSAQPVISEGDGFALFGDLALPQEPAAPAALPLPQPAPGPPSPEPTPKRVTESVEPRRVSQGGAQPGTSARPPPSGSAAQAKPVHKPSAPATPPRQRSASPPAYADLVGAAPNGIDSDSSVEAPAVPSVFIRIRHVLQQGQDALTQGVASVSAAAGDFAARMPRPDSLATAAHTATSASPSAVAPPSRAASAATRSEPRKPLHAEPDAAPAASTAAATPPQTTSKSKKKTKPNAAAAPAAIAPEMDFLGLSDPPAPASAAPQQEPAAASPEADLLGGDDVSRQRGAPPRQAAQPSFAAVDDLDDFFQGGASEPPASAQQRQAGGPSSSVAAAPPSDLIGGMGASAHGAGPPAEAGDVFLESVIADARGACATLSPDRASRVQQAIASAREYVESRVAAKHSMAGVTAEGINFARLNASRTAGQILEKSYEHQVREAQHEADVAEASEYKDEIKASIKKWAFQGGQRRGLRNLLMDLDSVLWEGAVWKCKSLADVSTDAQVKKWLNKARLLLHTDKMSGQPEKVRLRAELILIEIDKALKGTM